MSVTAPGTDHASELLRSDGAIAERFRRWLPTAAAVTVVLAVHSPSLGGPFFWDDEPLIVGNPAVRQGAPFADWFLRTFWPVGLLQSETGGLYRPLTLLSYRADWLVHGENAAGFHATNVLLHACNALLLSLVAVRLGATRVAALFAALLWALLPRLTECSAWISGRTDMLALAGVLLAFALWPWGDDSAPQRTRVLGACVALFLGLLSKEVAAAGGLALLAVEARSGKSASRGFRLATLSSTGIAYIGLRLAALGSDQLPRGGVHGLGWRAGRVFAAAGHYLVMVLSPWRPAARIGTASHYDSIHVALGIVLLVLACLGCLAAWRRRNPPLLAVSILGIAALSLVLHIVSMPSDVIASDRFLYVPAASLALTAALLAARVVGAWRKAAAILAVLASVALAWGTIRRIAQWNEPVAFWVDTCSTADPANYMPGAQLGLLLDQAGYPEEAIRFHHSALTRVAASGGSTTMIAANLGESLARAGRYEEAARAWREVVRAAPELGHAWLRLGRVEAWNGRWTAARASTQRAAQVSGYAEAAQQQMARLNAWQGIEAELPSETIEMDAQTMLIRARSLALLGRTKEAQEAWRAILERAPASEVADEAFAFFAQMGEPRHAAWALSVLNRSGSHDPIRAALAQGLAEKAQEDERITSEWRGIEACATSTIAP